MSEFFGAMAGITQSANTQEIGRPWLMVGERSLSEDLSSRSMQLLLEGKAT